MLKDCDVWIRGNGVSTHTRADSTMCNCVPSTPEKATIFVGNSTKYSVDCYGELDVLFHSKQDVRITLTGVTFISSLGCNLFNLHAMQVK